MINKRLVNYLKEDQRYIYLQVLMQWLGLLMQIAIISLMALIINNLYLVIEENLWKPVIIIIILFVLKGICGYQSTRFSFQAAKNIKGKLRKDIYTKVLALNNQSDEYVSRASLTQLMSEGVEQLEIYFGKYLPQFIYSMLAPITLFIYLMQVDLKAALVLLICVPLIPVSIVLIQKFAKKLLNKYWGLYGNLADRFLDNVNGLTTLKSYQSDQHFHEEMNQESSRFRNITMKVLVMQLNSISIMDLVAYGGAAIGIIVSLYSFKNGSIDVGQTFLMIMLSAEFFIPLRLLGSFFHIAMNGNAASEKIFRLLDAPISQARTTALNNLQKIALNQVSFGYDEKLVLNQINLVIDHPGVYGVVGSSGSGKSTLGKLLMGYYDHYQGNLLMNDCEIKQIKHHDIVQEITLVEHNPCLFTGTVRSNLFDGNEKSSDEAMIQALKDVNLWNYFRKQDGLDTVVEEQGNNLSGGQKQRLSIARALLHDSHVYIFDEATSNIDVESENIILDLIMKMGANKIIILISHRLASVYNCRYNYIFEQGQLIGHGRHEDLLQTCKSYYDLVMAQQSIEQLGGGKDEAA